jgi:hypothetical protein
MQTETCSATEPEWKAEKRRLAKLRPTWRRKFDAVYLLRLTAPNGRVYIKPGGAHSQRLWKRWAEIRTRGHMQVEMLGFAVVGEEVAPQIEEVLLSGGQPVPAEEIGKWPGSVEVRSGWTEEMVAAALAVLTADADPAG